ncbi:MAG TPA: maleylpyruvate isomerase N-terminal domain-containing protein [Acidimicrobiales bacterium]|nr:maleylpyruvate isomerase N-terminal domain-containing protein [Acidimicrobiales bacterium]
MDADPAKDGLRAAAGGFSELVGQLGAEDWERPGLGEWDVRGLVGHTSRALSTIETYLGKETAGPLTQGPVAYYLKVLSTATDPEERRRLDASVAERGREAGASLGDDPALGVSQLLERIVGLVDRTPRDALLATPAGTMTLADYLPTRTFELAVHSLDLARCTGLDVPSGLLPAVTSSCVLAGELAGALPAAPDLLLLWCGRTGLPDHLTIL